MNIFIILFILALNIVNILLIYRILGKEMKNTDKMIFIAIGIAIMFGLVSIVYWLSGLGLDSKEAAEAGKDFVTLTFVPINSLIVITFLSSSYKKYKERFLELNELKNRCVILLLVLVVLLVGELFYFKNIQNNALEILKEKQLNNQINNTINETDNGITNTTGNEIGNETKNIVGNEAINKIDNSISNITNNVTD